MITYCRVIRHRIAEIDKQGRRLFIIDTYGFLSIYDTKTLKLIYKSGAACGPSSNLCISPNGKVYALLRFYPSRDPVDSRGYIEIYNKDMTMFVRTLSHIFNSDNIDITKFTFISDNQLFVYNYQRFNDFVNVKPRIINIDTDEVIMIPQFKNLSYIDINISNDGNILCYPTNEKKPYITLIKLPECTIIKQIILEEGTIGCCKFNSNNTIIAINVYNKLATRRLINYIYLINIETGEKQIFNPKYINHSYVSFSFNSSDTIIALNSHNTNRNPFCEIWNIETSPPSFITEYERTLDFVPRRIPSLDEAKHTINAIDEGSHLNKDLAGLVNQFVNGPEHSDEAVTTILDEEAATININIMNKILEKSIKKL